jgi:hypothetical protein
MKNLQLMLHLQRLLDGELPDTGLDDLEDLGTDDLEGGEASDLEDLGPIMEELDEMNAERDDPLDGLDMDLDGMESLLETDDAGAVVPGTGGADDDLKRLEELINPGAGRSPGRARPAASARRPGAGRSTAPARGEGAAARGRDGRLKRLLRVLDDVDDVDPVEEDVRRLRHLVGSRMASGGAAARRDPFDPVILRRREQIREFLAAWRETLRAARRRERQDKP